MEICSNGICLDGSQACIQYPGALYYVINRGNYRSDIFASEGAREAFLTCLGQACEMTGWRVHAFVVMRNHYHLALETPAANLVEGMQWLQSTYATRFNQLRKERGPVFQGRYHAILVQDGAHLGAVAHYIHLNPVRASIVEPSAATNYRWSSLHWLTKQYARPSWLSFSNALASVGELTDTPAGHAAYLEYLAWLNKDKPAQKAFAFDQMCKGWALGSKEFKANLIQEQRQALAELDLSEVDASEVREMAWTTALAACMEALGQEVSAITRGAKSADWKVAIAAHLRRVSTVKNTWLAEALNMGAPDGVSRYVSELRQGKRSNAAELGLKITDISPSSAFLKLSD